MRKLALAILVVLLFGLAGDMGAAQAPRPSGASLEKMRAFWARIRQRLDDPDGEEFWKSMKGCALPPIAGTLISASPPDRPSVLIVAMSDATTPEVTLLLKGDRNKERQLNGPLMRGSLIQVDGAEPISLQRDPLMLTLNVY